MNLYICAPHSNWFRDAMDIYLAGAATDNNNHIWKQFQNEPDQAMDVFLAGLHAEKNRANAEDDFRQRILVLESFYYMDDWMVPYIRDHWDFLLDSGAFTFMNDTKNAEGVSWEEYTERYAQFIVENDIDLFFELDIDAVVGIKRVEEIRKRLEDLTDKLPIPVWHKTRGKKYWEMMIEKYPYVALGGMASNVGYKDKVEAVFPYFINTARKAGAKIHALGYTSIKGLRKYKFDSVDSTAWLYGNRGGFLYHFNGRDLEKRDAPEGHRLKARPAAIHNFREWVKFQHYAKTNL